MSYPTKIATCCYCGTRAALVLKGKSRHELACGSCGAPLHDLKMLPKDKVADRDTAGSSSYSRHKVARDKPKAGKYRPDKKRKQKPRKSWMRDLLEEAVDLIEDVFD